MEVARGGCVQRPRLRPEGGAGGWLALKGQRSRRSGLRGVKCEKGDCGANSQPDELKVEGAKRLTSQDPDNKGFWRLCKDLGDEGVRQKRLEGVTSRGVDWCEYPA